MVMVVWSKCVCVCVCVCVSRLRFKRFPNKTAGRDKLRITIIEVNIVDLVAFNLIPILDHVLHDVSAFSMCRPNTCKQTDLGVIDTKNFMQLMCKQTQVHMQQLRHQTACLLALLSLLASRSMRCKERVSFFFFTPDLPRCRTEYTYPICSYILLVKERWPVAALLPESTLPSSRPVSSKQASHLHSPL